MKARVFKIEIIEENSAFDDGSETARILRRLADRIEAGRPHSSLFDSNGNCVGHTATITRRI